MALSPVRRCTLPLLITAVASCGAPAIDPVDDLGSSEDPIQGGQVMNETSNPEIGRISTSPSINGCTGTLIGPSVVLSAWHCFSSGPPYGNFFNNIIGSIPVTEVANVGRITPAGLTSDAAVLHLASPVRNVVPRPVEGVQGHLTGLVNQLCTLVGYGRHDENGGFTFGIKRHAIVRVTGFQGALNYINTEGINGYGDVGDSGGPLICNSTYNVIGALFGSLSAPNQNLLSEANLYEVSQHAWKWQPEPAFGVTSPSVASRLDVFGRGDDGALMTNTRNGSSWSGWTSLGLLPGGLMMTGTPEAISGTPGRMDVFTRALNTRALWMRTWQGSWAAPTNLGSTALQSHPSVVSWGSGRFDIFAVDTNGNIVHKDWTGSAWQPSQTGYESLGQSPAGPFTEFVKAVTWGPNHLAVFAIGPNKQLYVKSGTGFGSWGSWTSLGGSLDGQFAVTSRGSNLIDIIIRQGTAIHRKVWNGSSWVPSQTGWTAQNMTTWTGASAIAFGGQTYVLSQTGATPSGQLQVMTCGAPSACTNPQTLGGSVVGSPVLGVSMGKVDVLFLGTNMGASYTSGPPFSAGSSTSLGGVFTW